jgi:hypothetical protein
MEVRTLRVALIHDIVYPAGTVLTLDRVLAEFLARQGIVAVLSATPAPRYSDQTMTAHRGDYGFTYHTRPRP